MSAEACRECGETETHDHADGTRIIMEPDPERTPPPQLEELYEAARAAPSDINEHLATLRGYASECEHVTEMGMRSGVSTLALLAAQPRKLISWDINPLAIISQNTVNLTLLAGRTQFQPRVGDTLEIVIEPTDMLFIDTLHTAKQLKAELERHADPVECKVKKYLAFHDTVTFGTQGEDGSEPGLRAAIRWFQKCHAFPLWELIEDRQNNNGLVVLRRVYE